jgi:hypothetical protein
MFEFSASNPIPLLPLGDTFRQGSKAHAAQADTYFGYQIESVEQRVQELKNTAALENLETWTHLNPQFFLTSYLELRALVHLLNPPVGSTIVELGCAYARLGLVCHLYRPDLRYIGIEAVAERCHEARRVLSNHGAKHAVIECSNLASADVSLPKADIYFMYDMGTEQDVSLCLQKLQRKKFSHLIARGSRCRKWIETHRKDLEVLNPPGRTPNFSVYVSF